MVQERLFHRQTNEGGDSESITLFFLAAGTLSSFLLAWLWTVLGPWMLPARRGANHDDPPGGKRGLNHPLLVVTSLAYLSAMAASNESLHYVSYPTCVLAKSSKLIPTMGVGWLVDRWRARRGDDNRDHGKNANFTEWTGAALITVGIVSFQYLQLQKRASPGEEEVRGDSPYGLALLGLSLLMDGVLGACQSALKQNDRRSCHRAPGAMESMLWMNLYATLVLLPASHFVGQFWRGLETVFAADGDGTATLFCQMLLSASVGQVFVFLTVHHFSPLTCTTITTTRKFLTILFSVYKFGHVLECKSWLGIGLVFSGLYLQIATKFCARGGAGDAEKEKEKRE